MPSRSVSGPYPAKRTGWLSPPRDRCEKAESAAAKCFGAVLGAVQTERRRARPSHTPHMFMPQFAGMVCPVMAALSSEARNTHTAPTSDSSAGRRSEYIFISEARASS